MNSYQAYLAAFAAARSGALGLMPVNSQLDEASHVALALGVRDGADYTRDVLDKKTVTDLVKQFTAP